VSAARGVRAGGPLGGWGVELAGAGIGALPAAEDRQRFKDFVPGLGAEVPGSRTCHTVGECERAARELGYPLVVRPSFTLGGAGSGVAHHGGGLRRLARAGPDASPVTQVLLEGAGLGWDGV